MSDDIFTFDNTKPINDMRVHDTMEMASDEYQNDHMETTRLSGMYNDEEDVFKFDNYDNIDFEGGEVDDDDLDEYGEEIVSKKRKRVGKDDSDSATPAARYTSTRIKAEGGETFMLDDESPAVTHQQSSRVVGAFGRRDRGKSENLPAYHKKVSAELDSDDELMLQMRENGYSDRQIADKLAKDGRVRYDQKSISTRIMRIRLAQAEKFDVLLKEGYKEWKFEDDQHLVQAYALADIEISHEIERIRAWRFRKVSEYMRRLDKESLFSANACRSRYTELMAGTARIPIEVDDDPDTRREEFKALCVLREAARAKEAAEQEMQETMQKRVADNAKIKTAQKAEEVADKRAAKEAEKARRAMQRAAQAQLRAQKAAENQKAKTERNAQIKKAASALKKRGRKAEADTNTATTESRTEADAIDPRSYLNMTDLTTLCANRGLPTGRTKKELVASLIDADMEWTHDQLRKMCKAKGLSAAANKVVMRYQLALKAAQMCPSFEAGMKAAGEAESGDGDEMMVDAK